MLRNTLSNSNSNARRAFIARSTNRGRVFDGARGCPRLRRNKAGHRLSWNLEHSVVACLCIRTFFVSGYRGFASVLQNPPSRVSDVFHVRPSVRFVTDRLRRLISNLAKGFVHDGLKNSVNRASISFGARTNE